MLCTPWLSCHVFPPSTHSAWPHWPLNILSPLLSPGLSTYCSFCLELLSPVSLWLILLYLPISSPNVTSPEQPSDHLIQVPPAWVTVLVFPVLMQSEIFLSFIYLFIFCSSHCPTYSFVLRR